MILHHVQRPQPNIPLLRLQINGILLPSFLLIPEEDGVARAFNLPGRVHYRVTEVLERSGLRVILIQGYDNVIFVFHLVLGEERAAQAQAVPIRIFEVYLLA